MQRLLSLGALFALVGGGWSVLSGKLSSYDLQRVAGVVQSAVGSVAGQQTPQAPFGGAYPGAAPVASTPYGMSPYSVQGPAPGYQAVAPPGAIGPTIRVATFNIQVFGAAKAQKARVMSALGQIIRMFDVVAIQEIRTDDDYFVANFLRQYVNNDGRTFYDARVCPRLGRTTSKEQYAFLFNTATIEVHPQVNFVVPDPQDQLHRPPHVAMFRTRAQPVERAFTFVLMNTHTDPDEVPQELDALYGFYREVQRMPIEGVPEDDVILLGDLNTNIPASGPYTTNPAARPARPSDFFSLARVPGLRPVILSEATNTRGTMLYDNLLFSRLATTEFTGRSGVVNLAAMFSISLEQALEISDHQPVWAEFSAYESQTLGSLAQRP